MRQGIPNMIRKAIVFILILVIPALFITPAFASTTRALEGKVIILDAGHGSDTTNYYRGYCEHTTMLSLAHKIKPLLEERGATVHLTRPSSEGVLLSTRIAMSNIWSLEAIKQSRILNIDNEGSLIASINEIDRLISVMQNVITDPETYASIYFNTPFSPTEPIHPDLLKIFRLQSDPVIGENFLFISLHSNATGRPINTAVHGADVFHASNQIRNLRDYYKNYSYVHQNEHFGNIILDYIHDVGIQRRKVDHANFFVIREHNIPAVLVENGHHTNSRDRENLINDFFLERLAYAYLDAITDYFADLPLPRPQTKYTNPILFGPEWFVPYLTMS